MEIEDPVYGSGTVEDEVLLELIDSDPVQRLKNVRQAGPSPFFFDRAATTRYEHSIGVMMLLKRFDAPIEEQVAGLLHDVPHTAFSHVADFVFRREDHDYHEDFMEEIVMDSDIPGILADHGLEIDYILEESNFPLLEQEIPDICADRIDYFLRDALKAGVISKTDIEQFMASLEIRDGKFVLNSPEAAEKYALKYVEADEEIWANHVEVATHEVFASALRRALETGIIEEEDLFSTDEEVMQRLKNSGDEEILDRLEKLEADFEVMRDRDKYDFSAVTKPRFVDPPVVTEKGIVRISELSSRVRQKIEEHQEDVEGGYRLRIET